MQTLFLILLLAAILALLAEPVQRQLIETFGHPSRRIWILSPLLTGIFSAASLLAGACSLPLTAAVLLYTTLPVAAAWMGHDLLAVLLLWLPIEFAAGAALVPVPARGFLHSVAYGTAILLGLILFLGFRKLPGMKYRVPQNARDWRLPLLGFVAVAPVLIVVGMAIGFIAAPHLPIQPARKMALAVGIIFAGTALPEEILFRALIQNILMQRFGATTRTLLVASLVFGAAHLDNGPQPLPNWRYMIEATIAGVAYGKVFQKSNSVCSSAILHTLVDWTKHFFF